jgi:hypothetical protein
MNKLVNFYYLARQKIAESLSQVWSSRFVRIYLFLLLIINIFIWIGARYVAVVVDANQIALHYSVGFGIDYYGDTEKIYIIPLLGLLIIFLNLILFSMVGNYKDKNFIAHVLFAGAIVANIILLISILSIYIINF